MFPNPQHPPAHPPQRPRHPPVTRLVRRQLLPPERRVVRRLRPMLRAAMPETAVHKHRQLHYSAYGPKQLPSASVIVPSGCTVTGTTYS